MTELALGQRGQRFRLSTAGRNTAERCTRAWCEHDRIVRCPSAAAPNSQSQITTGGPPLSVSFLSLPSAKNASDRLSGDQNGDAAPSVPASLCCAEVAEPPDPQRGGWPP